MSHNVKILQETRSISVLEISISEWTLFTFWLLKHLSILKGDSGKGENWGFLTADPAKVVVDSSLPILLDTREKFKEQKHIFNFLPHFDTIRYRNINFLPYWIRILLHIINEVFIVFNIINVYLFQSLYEGNSKPHNQIIISIYRNTLWDQTTNNFSNKVNIYRNQIKSISYNRWGRGQVWVGEGCDVSRH